MKFIQNITADGSYPICQIDRRRSDSNNWQATVFMTGTFGGGTCTIELSPDQGTTLIPAKDWIGNAIDATSNAVFTTQPVGNGNHLEDFVTLYAVMSGSTSPSMNVTVFDNR